jgi:carbamoyltransferase
MGSGHGLSIKETTSVGWPHTLGGLYAAVTQHLGFEMFADEYKVMGLAAYGRPVYLDRFREMIVLTEDGFRIDPSSFAYFVGRRIWAMGLMICSGKFHRALGPPRAVDDPVEERHADLAASLQARTEEVLVHFAREAVRRSGLRNLCLAGGVMLNSVAVGKIMESGVADAVFVPPCAGDAGASLGAALHVSHMMLGLKRAEVLQDTRLGPEWGEEDIRRAVERTPLRWTQTNDPITSTVEALEAGQVVGWFQGRMEFGQRALGARSILADPRRGDMKDLINAKVKFREPFRPFAPAIPEERFPDFFLGAPPSPFMTQVYQVREDRRDLIPAVTHIDGTARVQTVRRDVDPLLWGLLEAFGDRTGVPILLNTSFNVKGEPIVNSPTDAVNCFFKADLDLLVMGRFLARKRLAEGVFEEETAPS